MATLLKTGSSGDDVKNLQTQLNSNGYSLDVNGVYDDNTLNAVKDYQSKNGLTVDGIVGEKTTAKLNSSSTNSPTAGTDSGTSGSSSSSSSVKSTNSSYVQSQAVTDAYNKLQETLNGRPNDYLSKYDDQIKELSNKILNRDPFSYDLNADMLYQQYKDQYQNLGQQAMRSTVGDVANMTGGYANSYAATAGNQAYQGYLQQLNDRVPELYQLARDTYDKDYNNMLNEYNMYRDLDNTDYARYADELQDYYNRAQLADSQYQTLYNQDYNQWLNQRNYEYQLARDAVADAQWNQLHGSGSGGSGSSSSKRSGSSSGSGSGSSSGGGGTAPTSAQITEAVNAYYRQLGGGSDYKALTDKLAKQGVDIDALDKAVASKVDSAKYYASTKARATSSSNTSSTKTASTALANVMEALRQTKK